MKQATTRSQRGFSLLELVVVIAVLMILAGMSIPLTQSTMANVRANNAMYSVTSQLRMARGLALSKRRNVQMTFTAPNMMQIHVWTLPGEVPFPDPPPVYLNDNIAGGAQFVVLVPQDTPMAFGNSSAITYNPAPPTAGWAVICTTSGALVGADASVGTYTGVGNSNPLNVSIFLGLPGKTYTARAITIFGATGRVRSYGWDGTQWFE